MDLIFENRINSKVKKLNDFKVFDINFLKGYHNIKNRNIYSYSNSLFYNEKLDSQSYLTSHCLIKLKDEKYKPILRYTNYIYTSSYKLSERKENYIYSKKSEVDYKISNVKDMISFFLENIDEDSILILNFALIAGDVYTYLISNMKKFEEKKILIVFCIDKNNSNLIRDNILNEKKEYNSDNHWLSTFLKRNTRTSFFKYEDSVNIKNNKIFCYLNISNNNIFQRVEFYSKMYYDNEEDIDNIINLISYFFISQGDLKTPKIRLSIIAKMYSQEYLNYLKKGVYNELDSN